ncbi:MAG TPA: arginase [Candidatus Thermoplasmatota archaeon]|nr:arginase [Candidatus Thermoplasmatota archaeon]
MRIHLVGAPLDLGQERRGVDMGPSAIRAARLERALEALGHEVEDEGNIHAPEMETKRVKDEKLRFLDEIVRACETLANRVEKCCKEGAFPLVLGGDHSIAMGTMAGLVRARGRHGIIWFDAHGDFNTYETTPSGNIHGMPLSACCGLGHPKLVNIGGIAPKAAPENVALVGVRNLDPGERKLLQDAGVHVYTMRELDERGIRSVVKDAIKVTTAGTQGVHLSFDTDVLDPAIAPGTGTPWPGGLTYREAHLAMEMLGDAEIVTSAEIVEVNPLLDTRNKTAELSVDLLSSLFGKRIL